METLLAPEGTIADAVDQTSLEAEEQATPQDVVETETPDGSGEETQEAPDPIAALEALLEGLSDEQAKDILDRNPKLKKHVDAKEFQARQSEADKAAFAQAQQAEQMRRSQATAQNMDATMAVIAEEFKRYQDGDADFNPQRMQAARQTAASHAFTVGMLDVNRTITGELARRFPDYRPEPNDARAVELAFNQHDIPAAMQVIMNVFEKAVENRVAPSIRSRIQAEQAQLAQAEAAVKTTQKAQAEQVARPKPTSVTGTTAASRPYKTVAEFDRAFSMGQIAPPPGTSIREWSAKQTAGLPAQ